MLSASTYAKQLSRNYYYPPRARYKQGDLNVNDKSVHLKRETQILDSKANKQMNLGNSN